MTKKAFRKMFVNKKVSYKIKATVCCWLFIVLGIVWESILAGFLVEFATTGTFMAEQYLARQFVYWTIFGAVAVIGKEFLYDPSKALNELRKEKRR